MIVVDENVDQLLIDKLKSEMPDVISIRQDYASVSDREVIKIAKVHKAVVITEDKDFGELVFASNIRGCSIILLRYDNPDTNQIAQNIFKVLDYYKDNNGHFFTTITARKIRTRKI
jgi:predicted nuclease of predicted toxin-antitoxin system